MILVVEVSHSMSKSEEIFKMVILRVLMNLKTKTL